MKVNIEPGKYVVAVSGGVDSVVLLDLLRREKGLELVVAHFDHGIRPDSAEDRKLVQQLAERYGLPFEHAEGRLGPSASEAAARRARYAFLHQTKEKYGAKAIITAHHQDDVIETAIINLLRGTGRKGLTALESKENILRPLLPYPKAVVQSYAREHELKWREDSTNSDTKYLRNYVRHHIVAKLSPAQRQQLVELVGRQRSVNAQLDTLLLKQLNSQSNQLGRRWFAELPHSVAAETMAAWLRSNGIREFDKATVERAVIGAKTARAGKKVAIKNDWFLEVGKEYLALERPER